jgi:hypothetical protein
MVYEDTVTCESCGANIVHLVCGPVTEDSNYRMCDACLAAEDSQYGEPLRHRR